MIFVKRVDLPARLGAARSSGMDLEEEKAFLDEGSAPTETTLRVALRVAYPCLVALRAVVDRYRQNRAFTKSGGRRSRCTTRRRRSSTPFR